METQGGLKAVSIGKNILPTPNNGDLPKSDRPPKPVETKTCSTSRCIERICRIGPSSFLWCPRTKNGLAKWNNRPTTRTYGLLKKTRIRKLCAKPFFMLDDISPQSYLSHDYTHRTLIHKRILSQGLAFCGPKSAAAAHIRYSLSWVGKAPAHFRPTASSTNLLPGWPLPIKSKRAQY